jgi:hypothetical protein
MSLDLWRVFSFHLFLNSLLLIVFALRIFGFNAAKEKLEIVSGAALPHFPSSSRRIRGENSSPPQAAKCVRTNLRILHS